MRRGTGPSGATSTATATRTSSPVRVTLTAAPVRSRPPDDLGDGGRRLPSGSGAGAFAGGVHAPQLGAHHDDRGHRAGQHQQEHGQDDRGLRGDHAALAPG